MSEIRDIKPADPLWPKRRTDKVRPDGDGDTPRRPRQRPRRRPSDGDDESKGGRIDEYA